MNPTIVRSIEVRSPHRRISSRSSPGAYEPVQVVTIRCEIVLAAVPRSSFGALRAVPDHL